MSYIWISSDRHYFITMRYCCCSVTQLCKTLWELMDCSRLGFPVLHHVPELALTQVHWADDAIKHLIFCCPLLLLPSIFPNIRIFPNESTLFIMWLKYCSFSICPSNEYTGLISFRIDWFDLLAVQGTSGVFSNTAVQKYAFFSV